MTSQLIPPSTEPVIAEVVPPPPSPWRFGLRALMALMVVCSVQFAVMSYLGVLAGMLVGTLVCFAVFGGIVVVGMALSGKGARYLPHLDQTIVRLMVALVILAIGTVLAGGGSAAYHTLARVRNEALLERDLGVSLKSMMLNNNNNVVWGLHVKGVRSGSVADLAGLRKDEVIVVDGAVEDFYTLLRQNRGKDVDVNVATGAIGTQSLQNCPQRSVTLPIPK